MAFFKKETKPESHFTTPRFPVHPLIDVVTGELMLCSKGDYVLNGGYSPHMAVNGKNNSNKTLIILSVIMTFLIRYRGSGVDAQMFETENTLEFMRCMQIVRGMCRIMGLSVEETEEVVEYVLDNFTLRGSKDLGANAWYDEMNEIAGARIKANKDKVVLPFCDLRGKPVETFIPHACGIDSFSALEPEMVAEKFLDSNTAGSSDNNTMYLKEAGAKTQMLAKWLNQNPRAGIYMFSSAHMGDNISLDPRSPPEKKNMFMKQNHKLKNVPEKYYYYTTTMFFVNGAAPLVNTDKVPIYPFDSSDKEKRDSKDILLEIIVLRNKFGQSGVFIPLIANQNMGIDWHLSAYHYCRQNKWGFTGNDQNYVLDLLPDVKLNRSVARTKLAEIPNLRRAVDITCEMNLLFRYKFDSIGTKYRCTPSQLYEDITALGYDWDVLLNTRGYYTLNHYEHPVKPLSTFDLLRMRVGDYIPYWMDEKDIPEKAKTLRDSVQKAA